MNPEPWRPATALQRLIGSLLHLSIRTQYRVEVAGLAHFSGSPATLVVANHRRDTDVPMIATALGGRHGPVRREVLPHFVAREDLFRPGFLGHYLDTWPALLRTSLAAIPIDKIIHALQAHPMRRIPERSLREVLEDILRCEGDLAVHEVLRPAWIEKFHRLAPDRGGPLTVQECLDRRYAQLLRSDYGLARLSMARFRQRRQAEQAAIAGHLDCFIRLLEQGAVVQIEPEGRLSRDGRLGRMRSALYILLNAPQAEVRVLPVAVTYDAMTRSRPGAFVRFGAETFALRGLSQQETNRCMAALLARLMTLTASQLGCHFLRRLCHEAGGRMQVDDLDDYMRYQAQAFAAAGAPVDPRLLDAAQRRARVLDFLGYCQDSGLLVRDGAEGFRFHSSGQAPPVHVDQACDLLEYMDNEWAVLASGWELYADCG
jgi:1-acyl-sn-glycerol-3-phosphate acyltransferase